MSDFDENLRENRNESDNQPENEPENRQESQPETLQDTQPETQPEPGPETTPGYPSGNAPGSQDGRSSAGQPGGNGWAYTWDGASYAKKRSGKGVRTFLLVAAACLVLSVAICLPTILFTLNDREKDPSAVSSRAVSEAGVVSDTEETSYEISQTVSINENPYVEESALTEVYKKCSPSCCTIYVEIGTRGYGIGSGFVLTEDGYIATNQHVVDGGTYFKVIFYDGEEYEATVVGEDPVRDLAVIKIDAKDLTPLKTGNSAVLAVGQTVIAIGTPYDTSLAGTMTMGIISGLNREVDITDDYGKVVKTMTLLQTDTIINPGNSGGPMINLNGEVVGINSMKIVADEYEGIGFAIPINSAVEIFNQLIEYGRVVSEPEEDFVRSAAKLGVTVYNLDVGLQYYRIYPKCDYPTEGILVTSVSPDSAVYQAGLGMFNIITEFCGVKITDVNQLTEELAKHNAGEEVTMKIFAFDSRFSSGEYKELTFKLDAAS